MELDKTWHEIADEAKNRRKEERCSCGHMYKEHFYDGVTPIACQCTGPCSIFESDSHSPSRDLGQRALDADMRVSQADRDALLAEDEYGSTTSTSKRVAESVTSDAASKPACSCVHCTPGGCRCCSGPRGGFVGRQVAEDDTLDELWAEWLADGITKDAQTLTQVLAKSQQEQVRRHQRGDHYNGQPGGCPLCPPDLMSAEDEQ